MSPVPRAGAAALATGLVAAGLWFSTGIAAAGTVSGVLYRDTDTAVARWVAANPSDSRMPVIRDKIASQPASHWFANVDLSTIQSDVSGYVGAAHAAGEIPVLTVYGIPNRDCGGASAGGASDLTQYQSWISGIASGLGSYTAIVILEPDSLALQTCLSSSEISARDAAIDTATRTLKAANPQAKVYLDAGHSTWNTAADQASRLVAAGVADADGFSSNVSNFNPTSSETTYGQAIIAALTSAGVAGKHQVIDTSRNGGASGDWCGDDNTDRRIGQYPTTATGDANIDAYLWVKPPGEADGCVYTAGSFQPDLAYSLASTAPYPPSPSASPSASSSSDQGCTAAYVTASSWQGGFQGQVTVTAGATAIGSWSVGWTLGSGQSISQVWNGALTTSGSAVTVRNASWNGALAAGATTSFGFIANGTASVPPLSCTA